MVDMTRLTLIHRFRALFTVRRVTRNMPFFVSFALMIVIVPKWVVISLPSGASLFQIAEGYVSVVGLLSIFNWLPKPLYRIMLLSNRMRTLMGVTPK